MNLFKIAAITLSLLWTSFLPDLPLGMYSAHAMESSTEDVESDNNQEEVPADELPDEEIEGEREEDENEGDFSAIDDEELDPFAFEELAGEEGAEHVLKLKGIGKDQPFFTFYQLITLVMGFVFIGWAIKCFPGVDFSGGLTLGSAWSGLMALVHIYKAVTLGYHYIMAEYHSSKAFAENTKDREVRISAHAADHGADEQGESIDELERQYQDQLDALNKKKEHQQAVLDGIIGMRNGELIAMALEWVTLGICGASTLIPIKGQLTCIDAFALAKKLQLSDPFLINSTLKTQEIEKDEPMIAKCLACWPFAKVKLWNALACSGPTPSQFLFGDSQQGLPESLDRMDSYRENEEGLWALIFSPHMSKSNFSIEQSTTGEYPHIGLHEVFNFDFLVQQEIEEILNHLDVGHLNSRHQQSLEVALSFIVNSADAADWGQIIQKLFFGPGLGIGLALIPVTDQIFDLFLGRPLTRLILYAIIAFLYEKAIADTDDHIATTEENLEKIRALQEEFHEIDDLGGIADCCGVDEINIPDQGDGPGDQIGDGTVASGAAVHQSSKAPRTNIPHGNYNQGQTCLSGRDSQGNCLSFRDGARRITRQAPPINSSKYPEIEAGIQNMSNLTELRAGLVDESMRNGMNSPESLRISGQIAEESAALRRNTRTALSRMPQSKLDELEKAITTGAEDLLGRLKRSYKETLDRQGISMPIGSTGSPEEKSEEAGTSLQQGVSANLGRENMRPKKEDKNKSKPSMNEDFWGTSQGKTSTPQRTPSDIAGLKKGEEFDFQEISPRKETSIFQIISVRYLRSGYSRLDLTEEGK